MVNTKPTICLLGSNFWSQCAVELLLSHAVRRIHPLIIVIGENNVILTGLHSPPSYLEKRNSVSTRLTPSDAQSLYLLVYVLLSVLGKKIPYLGSKKNIFSPSAKWGSAYIYAKYANT